MRSARPQEKPQLSGPRSLHSLWLDWTQSFNRCFGKERGQDVFGAARGVPLFMHISLLHRRTDERTMNFCSLFNFARALVGLLEEE